MSVLGVVTNIRRDGDPADPGDGTPDVLATISGVGVDVPCRFFGEPPPPLTVARFADIGGGQWLCEGSWGLERRVVVHEDFTIVPTVTASGTAACDTPWTVTITGAGSSVAQYASLGLGCCVLTGGAASGRNAQINKDELAFDTDATDAFWCSFRAIVGVATSMNGYAGFQNAGGTDGARVGLFTGSSPNWLLSTVKDSSFGSATSATPVVAGTWYTIDMLLVPGVFAAMWVDGDGPYPVTDTTTIPTSGDDFTLMAIGQSLTTSARNLILDYIRVEALTGSVAHPDEHPILVNAA